MDFCPAICAYAKSGAKEARQARERRSKKLTAAAREEELNAAATAAAAGLNWEKLARDRDEHNEAMAALGVPKIPGPPERKLASRPECSLCGAPSAANSCAGCQMVSYCSRDCQKSHWKSGHRNECASLRSKCADDATRVLAGARTAPQKTHAHPSRTC